MRSDAQANRERVLAAAGEVFGEFGAVGSTEQVARRAGVGVATVFRHFPTKQLLVEATVVRHLDLLTDTARSRCGDNDAGEAFRATFREIVSGAPANLALLALAEEFADSVRTEEMDAAAAALRGAVDALIAQGQQAGAVRAGATVDEIYMLIRALTTVRGEQRVLHRAIDVVLDGLAAQV